MREEGRRGGVEEEERGREGVQGKEDEEGEEKRNKQKKRKRRSLPETEWEVAVIAELMAVKSKR